MAVTARLLAKSFEEFGDVVLDILKKSFAHKVAPLEERLFSIEARMQQLESRQMTFAGTHSEQKQYQPNDIVRRTGCAWICTKATSGAFVHTDWQLLVKSGDAR